MQTIETSPESIERDILDEETFTRIFKHKLTNPDKLGLDLWAWNPESDAYSIITPNGSHIRLRFYDTVKRIFDFRNTEIPGKESFLSYIEVVVMPAGIKGYRFRSDSNQVVWGPSKVKAQVKHEANIGKLVGKAKSLGFDLTHWRDHYDRTEY